MRLNLVLLGFTALATGIVLGDGEQHPYQYETSVSWHNPYSALSSGQSPNPLTSRQALATLLTPGVAAAFASFLASIGFAITQTTPVRNRIDEANRRVQTTENDIRALKRTDSTEATKVKALETSVGSSTSGLIKNVNDLQTIGATLAANVATLQTQMGIPQAFNGSPQTLYALIKDNCGKLGMVVNTANPAFTPGAAPPTPANAISTSIGTATGTAWPILFPLGSAAGGTLPAGGAGNGGLDLSNPVVQQGSTTTSNTALSIFDFNFFRLQTIQAIDALDNKIREMLSVTAPTCPP